MPDPAQNRHQKRKLITILLLLTVLPLTLFQGLREQLLRHYAAGTTDKPNVIMIYVDDQPDETLQYVPYVRDTLGNKGVTFTDAYVTTGLCCPSRASLLTGQYAHNHKVLDNREPHGMEQFNDQETLAVWLHRAGYRTALLGKYMNEYDNFAPKVPPGWDHWFAFDDKNGKYFDYKITVDGKRPSREYGSDPEEYSTDVLAREAVTFIKQNKNRPFFLYFAPHAPHGNPIPAPRDEALCNTIKSFPESPAFNEVEVADKPRWIQQLPRLSEKDIRLQKLEFRQKMCTLIAVDQAVKDMIQALGDNRDNTIIVYMSDNGYSFGDHRWDKKACFYQACIGVDLIISYPKLTPTKTTSHAYALNIDIAPTLLELTGAKAPQTFPVDGKSLVPILRDPTAAIRQIFLIETWNKKNDPKGEDYGVETKRYKYNKLSSGEEELYDLTVDPYELNNQARNVQYAEIKKTLSDQIDALSHNQVPPTLPENWIVASNAEPGNDETHSNRPATSNLSGEKSVSENATCLSKTNSTGCIPERAINNGSIIVLSVLGAISAIATVLTVLGGYLILTSTDNHERLDRGKQLLFCAILALLLALFGYVLFKVLIIDTFQVALLSH